MGKIIEIKKLIKSIIEKINLNYETEGIETYVKLIIKLQ
jgi:hypothetical protein